MLEINEIFDVKYGVNLELINLDECEKNDSDSISFVSRTEKNNGVSAYVHKLTDVKPNPADTLSVAGGGSVLSTFYQGEEYYSGRDVYVLIPKKKYSEIEMLFYAFCIRQNKYRYNYGRQANKTLKDIIVPETMPESWRNLNLEEIGNRLNKSSLNQETISLNLKEWKDYDLTDLFEISASRDELMEELTPGGSTPYVTSSDSSNGVTDFVEEVPTNSAGTITANRGGSVGYFFYQPLPYKATPVDVRILTPKFSINIYIGLFLKTILQLEKYRYNYSRKMGSDRLAQFKIKLPSKDEKPDWQFMEDYIKSLPYSASLQIHKASPYG